MAAPESQAHVPNHLDTIITRLEKIGFAGGLTVNVSGIVSRTMICGKAIAVVWHNAGSDVMTGCVGYKGAAPCDVYWAAREITDPVPRKIHSR